MKKLPLIASILVVSIWAASTAAFAHTSSAPHVHPHDVSILPDLSALLIAAFIVACGAFAVRTFGRNP